MNKVGARIEAAGRPLLGIVAHTYHPAFVEVVGLVGFDVLWIEMEHGHISFEQAANLCRVAAGVDLLTMIRVSDSRRENVLKAAECGPDIIDLPMGNSPDVIRELVLHARYAPEGKRGFYSCSRAVRYGLANIADEQKRINSEICLVSQVETILAVDQAEELSRVPGLDGIFIGPGDLSTDMGVPGDLKNSDVCQAIDRTIRAAKENGKLVFIPGAPCDAREYTSKGVDVYFCGGEMTLLKTGLTESLKQAKKSMLG